MDDKEMSWLKWRLCYVKNGICAFVDYLHLATGIDWVGTPARNADLPIPMENCHRKLVGFEMEKVTTDLFGKDSIFNDWNQRQVVSQGLPAFVVAGEVVKYGDDARTVILILKRHSIRCRWL